MNSFTRARLRLVGESALLTQQSLEVARHDVPVGSPQQLSGTAGQDRQFCPPLPLAGGAAGSRVPAAAPAWSHPSDRATPRALI